MARWAIDVPPKPRRGVFAGLLAGGIVALMVASDAYPARFWHFVGPVFVVLALVLLLRAHAVLEALRVPAGPVTRGLMVVGALAYGLYAWHGLLMVLWSPFQEHLALTYGLSLMLAWLSFVVLERPVMRWSARGQSRRPVS